MVSPTHIDEFEDLLQELILFGGGNAASASIIAPDGTMTELAVGFSNLENEVPAEINDKYRIASITKPFVAATVLSMVDEGLISLDDPIDTHISTPFDGEGITIRQLINHTSGIFNSAYSHEYGRHLGSDLTRWNDPKVELEIVADQYRYHEPGSKHRYSNTNYTLLGVIIEEVSGNELGEELATRVLEPAGLKDTWLISQERPVEGVSSYGTLTKTSFGDVYSEVIEGLKIDAGVDGREVVEFTSFPWDWFDSMTWAAAGMASTSGEVAMWMDALVNGEVISPVHTELMRTVPDVPEENFPRFEYAHGLQRYSTPWGEGFGHTGGAPGFANSVVSYPDTGWTIAVLSATHQDPTATIGRMMKILEGPGDPRFSRTSQREG